MEKTRQEKGHYRSATMHLSLFMVFGIFLYNNFPTESRKVTPDGFVYEAYKADAFRRITTHLINTTIVQKLGSCAFRCLKTLECVSFNFGNPLNGKHVCELLRTDKYNSRSSYVTSRDFHYFYPVNKCMNGPCQNNGSCYPDYGNHDYHCVCKAGFYRRNCETNYSNCSELRSAGYTTDGVYQIHPDGQDSFPVYCDMTTDGGGWTVFQKRFDGSVNFTRGWQDYKIGFGNLTGEFWLGLDKVHRLTKRQATTLRIDLEDWWGTKGYAVYSSFSIADESDFYRLNVSGYSGTAGDNMAASSIGNKRIHNGMRFSTFDKDNDQASSIHCAAFHEGGWWFNGCYIAYLNGKYIVKDTSGQKAMCWYSLKSDWRSLKSSQMKLK